MRSDPEVFLRSKGCQLMESAILRSPEFSYKAEVTDLCERKLVH